MPMTEEQFVDTLKANPEETLLDTLLSQTAMTTQNVSKGLLVEAREKAIQRSARTLKNWHKACLRDAVLLLTASGDAEQAQKAAVEYLKMDLNR